MKKKVIITMIVLASLLAGCSLFSQFQQAKEAYLETRVAEKLEELPVEELVAEVPTEEEPAMESEEKSVEETVPVEAEPTVEDIEEVEVPEETPTVEETPEEAVAPEETPEPVRGLSVEFDDPAIYLGDADWVDEMKTAEYWTTGSDKFTSAIFENDKFKITALSEIGGWRIASQPVLGNAYIEADVKMGTCKDADGYGLIFRVPENTGYNRGYLFGITCDGRYFMRKWDGLSGKNGKIETFKYYTDSAWINQGANQTNRIGVMALDDRLVLYVNGEKIDEVSDNSYEEGFFGIYINRDQTKELTISVNKVSYWTDESEE